MLDTRILTTEGLSTKQAGLVADVMAMATSGTASPKVTPVALRLDVPQVLPKQPNLAFLIKSFAGKLHELNVHVSTTGMVVLEYGTSTPNAASNNVLSMI